MVDAPAASMVFNFGYNRRVGWLVDMEKLFKVIIVAECFFFAISRFVFYQADIW